jgi:C1A family cysteine protease
MTIIKLIFITTAFLSLVSAREPILNRFKSWASDFNVDIIDETKLVNIFENWIDNDRFIDEHNSKNLSYVLGHNQFSGMSQLEFSKYLININNDVSSLESFDFEYIESTLPTYVNWIDNGAVSPVKDQGQCGSCWSFSTTGALEGAYYIKTNKLQLFSEQQLVDCDTLRNGGKDMGCNGGLMDNAFKWIEKNGGLCSELEYPYISGDTTKSGTCNKGCELVNGSQVKGIVDVPPSDDNAMMNAIYKQPVSVAIEADQREFQLYKSGVFTGACGTNLDHGVLVVGYGIEMNNEYYLVKNSWGEYWGKDGYIMLGKGKDPNTNKPYNNGSGQCGILLQASYPVL